MKVSRTDKSIALSDNWPMFCQREKEEKIGCGKRESRERQGTNNVSWEKKKRRAEDMQLMKAYCSTNVQN